MWNRPCLPLRYRDTVYRLQHSNVNIVIDRLSINPKAQGNPRFFGVSQPNLTGKTGKFPDSFPTFTNQLLQNDTIDNTLAGVAQLVERVALMTAKRSTSRSWVRAPPSAIPIKAHQSSCSFAFWARILGGGKLFKTQLLKSTCVIVC